MTHDELCWMPASALAAAIRRRKISPVEVVDAVLDRIARINPALNAFVTLTDDAARREAKAAERALMRLEASPTAYVQAWFDRLAWWQHARVFFERYDLLLSPTVATPAFELGILWPSEVDGKPVDREAGSAFTFAFNMTGQPAASVPCGFTRAGLPIGLQIVGRRFDDLSVLRASAAFERAQPWAARRPPEPAPIVRAGRP